MTFSTQPGSILVTGAGRGIGRAIAELFLSRGWRVGMYDVDAVAVAEVAGARERAVSGALDVRDAQQWEAVLAQFGSLDVLVNNAGVLAGGPFAEMDLEASRRMVEVNVVGTVNGSRLAYPYLRRSRGLLLNLCSGSALYGQPSLATYGATKAAVKSLTEALELEWHRDGIRVRSLVPLFVSTAMVTEDAVGVPSVGRLGVRLTPQDVAQAAWQAVHERDWPLRGPHRAVGRQARLLAAATAVSPDWAARLAVRRASA